ncbi:unnamed protein product [Pleuronectes platessa]|uniref:Uncharacterized protein n=1 Tax=Pleuronectes platessa TaxID=8262 RepID=A0A9N7Z732_PLEPL|nr:unnamed protein product [Pleuronectes platessa]
MHAPPGLKMSPATLNSLSQAAEALPFVNTARRYYRLDGLVRSSDRPRRSRASVSPEAGVVCGTRVLSHLPEVQLWLCSPPFRNPPVRLCGGPPRPGRHPAPGTQLTFFAPSPSSPRRRRLSVRHREVLIRWHLTAPARKAGRWRGLGTWSAAATLDACRALLADHLSYGDRWGNPPAGA